MLTDPHKMYEQFERVGAFLGALGPFSAIPKALSSALMAALSRWSDAYETKDWGSVTLYKPGARWTESEQAAWNSELDKATGLLSLVAATPGVRVVDPKEKPPNGLVIPVDPTLITGKVPSFWYVGMGAAALALVFTFMSKKERTP